MRKSDLIAIFLMTAGLLGGCGGSDPESGTPIRPSGAASAPGGAASAPGGAASAPGGAASAPVTSQTFYLRDASLNSFAWTFDGPVVASSASISYPAASTSQGVVFNPDRSRSFTVTASNGMTVTDTVSGASQSVALPAGFPELGWIMGVAYDSTRNHVSIVTLSGLGYFYRFDVVANAWLDYRSVNNVDYKTMNYDATADRYIAITTDGNFGGSERFDVLSHEGVLISSVSYAGLPGFDSSYVGQGSGDLRLFAFGGEVALVGVSGGAVRGIWKFNLVSRSGSQTYTGP